MEGRLRRNQQLVVCKDSGQRNAGLYYYCNRSGNFKTRSTGRRHLKSQGTSKLNTYCTAAITIKMTKDDCLEVTIHKTHYGHMISLGHLRIPEIYRLAIAGKLANEVDFQHILDNIRDKLGKSYQRIHLLTRKDIINIERTYCFTGNQRHRDDATSVHLWVEDMKTQGKNPVLLYKAQG